MVKVFLTQFPLNDETTTDKVVHEANEWLSGSPHNPFSLEDLVKVSGSCGIMEQGHHFVQYQRFNVENYDGVGITYSHKGNNGQVWRSELVGAKVKDDFWASFVVQYDAPLPSAKEPRPKKPRIVNRLIRAFEGGKDGRIPVQLSPHYIEEHAVEETARLITGEKGNILPIVYLSRDTKELLSLDAETLAANLGGMAHVMVEPSKAFSFLLNSQTQGRNAYNGAVGIYWPHQMASQRLLPQRLRYDRRGRFIGDRGAQDIIYRIVGDSLKLLRVSNPLTNDFIRGENNKLRMKELESEGEYEELLKLWDEENTRLEGKLAEQEERMTSLANQLRIANVSDRRGQGMMSLPDMTPMYAGEYQDLMVEVVENAMRGVDKRTRRYEVFRAILDANERTGEREQILDEIKSALSGYTRIDMGIRRTLNKFGFVIEHAGKHHLLYHQSNPEKKVTVASTPSDKRTGDNVVRNIKKTFF